MKFCSYCGKQLNEGEICSCPGSQEERASKGKKPAGLSSKKLKLLLIPAVLVVVLLIVIISSVSYAGSEIDLSEYIIIEEVTGLNGRGVLRYELDDDALMMLLWGEETNGEITEENLEAVMLENLEKHTKIGNAISCITLSADKESGLSNGDTVTVTATFENTANYDLSYHFKSGSKTYTVSGLTEGKSADPFAEGAVTVSFSGFSGQGEAILEVLSSDEPVSLFRYSLSQSEDLSNGDSVTLSVEYDEAELERQGYLAPEVTEMVFVVSGLGEYFDIGDAFPAEELADICGKALAYVKDEEANSGTSFTVTSPSVVHKAYFLKAVDPSLPHEDWWYDVSLNNAVMVVTSYKINLGTGSEHDREEWFVWVFPNYSMDESGNLVYVADDEYGYSMNEDSLDEVYSWMCEEFSDMEIRELALPVSSD